MKQNREFKLKWDNPDVIRTDILDTFPYEGKKQTITYTTQEFSAVCPFSGLPDIAEVTVVYIPDGKCVELKSLKLYFVSFRNVGMYQENITDRIHSDLQAVLEPGYLKIRTEYATRGGIDAVCEIETGDQR